MTYTGPETRGPGRPPGGRNRRTQVVLDLIQGRGDKDPLDALSEIVTKNQDASIVATAANILAPYIHSKRGRLLFWGNPSMTIGVRRCGNSSGLFYRPHMIFIRSSTAASGPMLCKL